MTAVLRHTKLLNITLLRIIPTPIKKILTQALSTVQWSNILNKKKNDAQLVARNCLW